MVCFSPEYFLRTSNLANHYFEFSILFMAASFVKPQLTSTSRVNHSEICISQSISLYRWITPLMVLRLLIDFLTYWLFGSKLFNKMCLNQFLYFELVSVSCSLLSDSLRSHRLWPCRLLCSWNSLGKNTGVGCHSLLQGIFPTQRSNPWLASPALQVDSLLLSHQEAN